METTVFRPRGARRMALAGALAVVALLGPPCVPADVGRSAALAQAVEASIDIDTFHQALSPYGDWVDSPQYGEVWRPTGVAPGWRPYYNDGHWVYSDNDGWTWVSDLPWGWAPFHYGRWAYDPQYGWLWVPGRVWGPAWVSFRQSDEAIGWAPLPPDTGFDPAYGYQGGNIGVSVGVDLWNFVRPEGFLEPRFDRYAYDRREYPRFVNQTRNITNITVINNRVVNQSVNVTEIERVTHRQVEHVTIADSDRPDRTRVNGKNVVIYKPAVVERGESGSQARTAIVKEDPGQDNKKRPATALKNQPPPNKAGTETTKNKEVKPAPGAPAETLQSQQEKKKQLQQPGTEQQPLQTQQTKKQKQLQQPGTEQQPLQTQQTKKQRQLQQPGTEQQPLQTQQTKKQRQLQQPGTEQQPLQTQETGKQKQKQKQMLPPGAQPQQPQMQSQNKKTKKAVPVTPEQQTAPSAGPTSKRNLGGQQPQLQHKPQPEKQQGQPPLKKQKKKCPQGAQCSQND